MSKLTWDMVESIRQEYLSGKVTQVKLGKKYGVSDGGICDIVNKKAWTKR